MLRSLDPAPFNALANHPDVRPWLGGRGEMNLAPLVTNTDNVCLLTPEHDGGYVVHKLQPGLYECHSMACVGARGRPMLTLMREGFAFMFSATDALELVTRVPDGNVAASSWADLAGFRETFRRSECFDMDGELVGASYRSLGYGDWVMKHRPNRTAGEAFHAEMHAYSPHLATHPEDPAHDAWVGATLLGCAAGNTPKAIALFNRWASFAGYSQATVLGLNPPTVDTGDAIVTLRGSELVVLGAKRPDNTAH